MHTIESVAAEVVANVKTKKWLSCTFQVQTDKGVFGVSLKAFGKWVQIIQCCGIRSDVPECKTLRELREKTETEIRAILRSL